ncbi:MAG: tRNA (guanosine(37)-N1)-methyltransferase TrmD [Candidatus Margulisiibacteriota bacterium]
MRFYLISLFPAQLSQFFNKGIFGRAVEKGLIEVHFIQLRDFAPGPHHKVDDQPFGGTRGMVLKPDVLYDAITAIPGYDTARILSMCPKGRSYTQAMATVLAQSTDVILICGYYEGIDERIYQALPIEKISIGEFILSSGELPALAIVESVARLIPGVIQKTESLQDDTYLSGLLEFPQYTQPREWRGFNVPSVLVSGHHARILQWRREAALKETLFTKPELLINFEPSEGDQIVLESLLKEEPDGEQGH